MVFFFFLLRIRRLIDRSGSWKTASFKKYNFEADGIPTSGGALHPLLKVREEIRSIFLEMGCGMFRIYLLARFPDKVSSASKKCRPTLLSSQASGALMLYSYRSFTPLESYKIHFTYLESIFPLSRQLWSHHHDRSIDLIATPRGLLQACC